MRKLRRSELFVVEAHEVNAQLSIVARLLGRRNINVQQPNTLCTCFGGLASQREQANRLGALVGAQSSYQPPASV
jgi:hypothetical protein